MSGVAAFGPVAARFARGLAPEAPVVFIDHLGIAEGLRECAQRRARNERFFVRPILQREDAARCDWIMPTLLDALGTVDLRRQALNEACAGRLTVNGNPIASHTVYSPKDQFLLQAAVRLADGVVATSESERRRVASIVPGNAPSRIVRFIDETVPMRHHDERGQLDSILIWAPHLGAEAASAFVLALSELRLPIVVVSATSPRDALTADWLPPASARAALQRAKLVVDTNAFGCDSIPGLADWGIPVVADVESGAQEHFEGVFVYDRSNEASIFDAVIAALGSRAPRLRGIASGEASIALESDFADTLLTDGPRVSVLIQTYDRPGTLRNAIESVRRQTYRNVETVVVIDGGPRLDDLAAEFPDVIFEHCSENSNFKTGNIGYSLTTGKYLCILNDDDVFFPNHIALLVTALEGSGAAVAHGDVLTAYLRGNGADWSLYGFDSNLTNSVDKSRLLVSNRIGIMSCMFRRSCIGDSELFDGSIPTFGDYGIWLRLIMHEDFIHVERITSCFIISNGGAQQQTVQQADRFLHGYQTVYERYPIADRPVIAEARERVLRQMGSGGGGVPDRPAAEVTPTRWPLWLA